MISLRRRDSFKALMSGSAVVLATVLAGCAPMPRAPAPAPVVTAVPAPAVADVSVWSRNARVRWTQARFEDLPGWHDDDVQATWPALWRSCGKPSPEWVALCQRVRMLGAQWGGTVGSDLTRQWLASNLQPWRVESASGTTGPGLLTGYFEPLVEGARQRQGRFQYPVHRAPEELGRRKPFFTRAELETTPAGLAATAGRELAWLTDPLDVLLVQVQGSTRVKLVDDLAANGEPRVVRLAFAGHNDQPYQSVARWLVDQGAFPLEQASWPAIRQWAQQNPARVPEMMRANPRVVFFREEPLPDAQVGPLGAQAVPLTPGRSIAVDRDSIPLGTPVWLDSTVPQAWSATPPPAQPLRRLVVAQDTGGAIIGAVRADFFWGWGDDALLQAGRTKQPLAMWVLWPRGNATQ